jgi:hypothetical protein
MAALYSLPVFAQTVGGGEFGIEQRVRNEDWNNLFDYNGAANDEREQIRYRTRVWTRLPLPGSIDLNVGLNSETNQKFGQINGLDEIIFETANIDIHKLFVKGLSLKVGRQDLIRGDGFLLLEGTPGDGSRSTYFNAAVLGYSFRKSTLEFMGILNPATDRFLPRVHDRHKPLTTWDDQALAVYYSDKNIKDTAFDAYFIHKKEVKDCTNPASPLFQPDRRIETAGGRLNRQFSKAWSGSLEIAAQWGIQRPTTSIRAWGGTGYLKRTFAAPLKPYLLGGYTVLTGDDPSDAGRMTGWDPLFSRWPRWGDLELYSAVPEKAVGYATNQKRVQIEGGFSPAKRLTCKLIYYHLGAFQKSAGSPAVFGTGLDRGDNFQARADFTINPRLKGHVEYETLLPGTFYRNDGRSYFLRFEMIATVKLPFQNLFHD